MKLTFDRAEQENDDVWSYFFTCEEQVSWIPGQSIRLELPRATWGVDERRFTIASAPHEGHIRITTKRSTSSFKQSLHALETGKTIEGYAIEGSFVWQQGDQPVLFLAGGIGITPYRALIAERLHENKLLNTALIYSSRHTPAVYERELRGWQKQDASLDVHILPQRVGLEAIERLCPDWRSRLVYVSGPTNMVNALAQTLLTHGLTEERLLLDSFTGYQREIQG